MNRLWSILFIIIFESTSIFSQYCTSSNDLTDSVFDFKTSIIKNTCNGLEVLNSPFHFDQDDWMTAGTVVGITSFTFLIDKPVRKKFESFHSKNMDNIIPIGDYYGQGQYALFGGGIAYLGGLLIGNEDISETGGMLVQTLIVTGVYTVGLKFILGRSRPYENEGPFAIEGFQIQNSDNSLPSGHTSTAFAVSTILARKFNNTYASIIFYGLAGATAFQRIYSDNHWLSDTILGAALGYFIGSKVYDLNTNSNDVKTIREFSISPTYVPQGIGISFNYNY